MKSRDDSHDRGKTLTAPGSHLNLPLTREGIMMWSLAQEPNKMFADVTLSTIPFDMASTAVLVYEIMLWAETVHAEFPDLYQVTETRDLESGLWQDIIFISGVPTANTEPGETIMEYS